MFYSATTGGFYDAEINKGGIPADAVEISPSRHAELLEGQANGLLILADKNGAPMLAPPPPPTAEELQAQKNVEARAYLAKTDWYVVRFAETGQSIPDDVRAARESARASVVE
jgi:hypothetical protein